jgi:hypothetical protein
MNNVRAWGIVPSTYISQRGVDDTSHFGDTPFDDVAKVLVVDVVVLLPNRPLSAFLEFILTISECGFSEVNMKFQRTYT